MLYSLSLLAAICAAPPVEKPSLHDDAVGLLWVIHNFARIGARAANVAAHTMFIIDRA